MTQDEKIAEDLLELINKKLDIDITTRSRKRKYAYARKVYCQILRKSTNLSLERIGKYVGIKHDTVIHSLKTFYVLDKSFNALYNECIYELNLNVKMIEKVTKDAYISLEKMDYIDKTLVQLRNLDEKYVIDFYENRLLPYVKVKKNCSIL